MPSLNDTYLAYQFIKKFTTPFDKWPAYAAGIIDADGHVLIKRDERTPDQDKLFGNYDQIICNLKQIVAKVPGIKSRLGLFAATALLLKEGEQLTLDNVEEKFNSEYAKVADINLIEGIKFRSAFANHEPEEETGIPHHVDAWHQSRQNGWCVQVLDKHGNQCGDAEYHYRKPDAMRARKQLMKMHNIHEEMGVAALPANNVGGGKIAGTKEAGDDPPVGKKAWDKYKRKNKKFGEMAFARRKGANNG